MKKWGNREDEKGKVERKEVNRMKNKRKESRREEKTGKKRDD